LPAATATVLGGVKVGTKSANQYVNGVAADGTLLWGGISATGAPLRLPPTDVSSFNGVDSYWYMDPTGTVRLQMPGSTTGIFIASDGVQTFNKLPICNIAPVDGNNLANKTYVDRMLPLAGGTMTGGITLPTTVQSLTWGTSTYNIFGASGGVAIRFGNANIVNFTATGASFTQKITTTASGVGIEFGSSGANLSRGSTSAKIKSSGAIELPADPVAPLEAATKQYVDAAVPPALADTIAAMQAEIEALKAEVNTLKGA
jgi:hypothetical protein